MQAVDFGGDLGEYIIDKNKKIPKAHLNSVCKFKRGKETCRYICLSANGYSCVKKTPMKKMIDERVADSKMKAMGDNCEGLF